MQFLRDDNVITSKPRWKLKHAHSILEYFVYFCQMSSQSILVISIYTVSNSVRFFPRHSVVVTELYVGRALCHYHQTDTHSWALSMNLIITSCFPFFSCQRSQQKFRPRKICIYVKSGSLCGQAVWLTQTLLALAVYTVPLPITIRVQYTYRYSA